MTVQSTTRRNDYTGNGAVDTYAYSFKIFANTDLRVTVRNTSGTETTLTLTTHYTVTGVGNTAGGNVVLVNGAFDWLDGDGDLKTGYTLTIRRVRPLTQLTDIRNQGSFFPEIHEDEFDRQAMIQLQQQDEIDRAIRMPETVSSTVFNPTLPASLAGVAGASVITNPAGDGFIAGPTADAITNAQTNATAAAASASAASSSASAAAASAVEAAASAAGLIGTAVRYLTFADSPVTVAQSDRGKVLVCNCSGGAITLNLPAISGLTLTNPFMFAVKKSDSSANKITIARNGTDTFDDGTTSKLVETQNAGAFLIPSTVASPDNWAYIPTGASAAGGGGASLQWVEGVDSPIPDVENNIQISSFGSGLSQKLYALVKVSASYVVGNPIKLKAAFYSAGTSNTVLMQTIATLIRAGTDQMSSTTNQRTSTNSAVTLSAGSVNEPQLLDFDLTSTTGQINSVSVSPNDYILVQLVRGTDSATDDCKVPVYGAEVTFS